MGDVENDVVVRLKDGLTAVDVEVDEWEPDPSADGWLAEGRRAKDLKRLFAEEVDGVLAQALKQLDEPSVVEPLHARVADLAASVAVYCHLSGDARGYSDTMERAVRLEPDDDLRMRYDAAKRAPQVYARIAHGRWLHLNRRYGDAKRVAKQLKKSVTDPYLLAAAEELLEAPRPLTSAPALWRVNGCGQALYGSRDHQPDGSYVATLCICLLFIPLIPIRAYRLWEESDGYCFQSIVPLSGFAKAARLLVVAALGLTVVGVGLSSHYGSDGYKAGVLLDEGRAFEEQGEDDKAIAKYHQAIDEYGFSVGSSKATTGIMRVAVAKVKDPVTADSLDQIERVANTFSGLPSGDNEEAKAAFVSKLLAWAEAIGDADVTAARARLAVLEMALPLDAAQAGPPRNAALAKLADATAAERPLMAVVYYLDITPAKPDVLLKVLAIFDAFPSKSPSLWLASERHVSSWLKAARASNNSELTRAAERIAPHLTTARNDAVAFDKLIEEGDEKKLVAANKVDIHNQEVAQALAADHVKNGRAKEAIAVLEATGTPGSMTADTHMLLARLYRDSGSLKKADALLTPFVEERLTVFQRVNREYNVVADEAHSRILGALRAGNVPSALEQQLSLVQDDDAKGEVVRQYLARAVNADPSVAGIRQKFLAHQAVVPLSLTLGMVKLSQANAAQGVERSKRLAQAEHAFLSIRAAAEGQPSYHLGLAQVYHRLGKVAEGDAEFDALLARDEPELAVKVATTYRSLGKMAKAREILKNVHTSSAPLEQRQRAASVLSIIAETLDEREKWLDESDQASPIVKVELTTVRGLRAQRAGDKRAADAAFAEAAAFWEQQAAHNPAAMNNAAVAWSSRYFATGKLAHMKTSASKMEESLRLQPDSPVVMENLLQTVMVVGLVEVLKDDFKVDVLMLDFGEAETLLELLLSGDDPEPLRRKLRGNVDVRRAVELAKQLQVLAPHKQSGYRSEISWLSWVDDVEGLRTFHQRLAQGQKIDVAAMVLVRRAFERGERDEVAAEQFQSQLRDGDRRLKRAKDSGHGPTIAAAELLLGQAKCGRAVGFGGLSMEDCLVHYRAAHKRWPHPGVTDALTHGLITAAILNARGDSTALAASYEKKGRRLGASGLAARLIQAPGGEAVRAAIANRAELAQALRVGEGRIRKGKAFDFYLAARWSQNSELSAAAVAVLDDPRPLLHRRIDVLLAPGEENEAADLKIFETARANRTE